MKCTVYEGDPCYVQEPADDSEVTAKDGLLWRNGRVIPLPQADHVAMRHGFTCAERFVKHLEGKSPREWS